MKWTNFFINVALATRNRQIVTTVAAEGWRNFQVKDRLREYEALVGGSDSKRKDDFSSTATRIEDAG